MENSIPMRSNVYQQPSNYQRQYPMILSTAYPIDSKSSSSMEKANIDPHNRSADIVKIPVATIAKGGVAVPFPYKLYLLLEFMDSEAQQQGKCESIVGWQPHGRAFRVHNRKAFEESILPVHFKMTRYASFQRQLNLYGFLRLTANGLDHGAVYHPCFVRGQQALLSGVVRQKIKGTRIRMKGPSPDDQPNFYASDSADELQFRAIKAHFKYQQMQRQYQRDSSNKNNSTDSRPNASEAFVCYNNDQLSNSTGEASMTIYQQRSRECF